MERLLRELHLKRRVSDLFKSWGRYLALAFVAMIAINIEGYVRAIPSNPSLNYAALGLATLAILGALLLRHSRWFLSYFKLVIRSIAWTFATIGIVFLAFPRDLIPFFSLQFSALANVALAAAIIVELTLVSLMFSMSDWARAAEDLVVARWKKKESTPDYDAMVRADEFG